MKKNIFEKAKKIIDYRRYDAENTSVNNKAKAFENREFKILYQCYISKMIENARLGIEDITEIENLKNQVESKRKELNLPELEPIFTCKKCNDTGFVEGRYCSCLIHELNELLKQESGFNHLEKFEEASFDIFENKEYMKKLYSKCKNGVIQTLINLLFI